MTGDLFSIGGIIFQHPGVLGYIVTRFVEGCSNLFEQHNSKLHKSVHKGLGNDTAEVLMTNNANAAQQAIVCVNIFNSITYYISN